MLALGPTHQRIWSVVAIVILLGAQLYMWRSALVTSASHALAAQMTRQNGAPAANEITIPVHESEISRVEIPTAGISAPVLDVQASEHNSAMVQWQMPHYALGHHSGSGLPGQGKNIIFSAVSGDYGRMLISLDLAVPGTTVTLYEGDTAHTYTVVSQQLIASDSALANVFVDTGAIQHTAGEQVTLITSWPPTGANRYSQYLVVIARPVS